MRKSSVCVVDSNIAIWTALPSGASVDVRPLFERWRRDYVELFAPDLWLAECTSVIRHYVFRGVLSTADGRKILDDLLALDIQLQAPTPELCRAALHWAERLNQARAYDSFYLALAERLGAQFWTADERLVNRAREVGAEWAHWVGEGEQPLL